MQNAFRWIGRWAVLALVAAPSLAAGQDVYIEARTHTDAVSMMGRDVPAQDGVNHTWIGDGKVAVSDQKAGTGVIFRADLGKMYVLFPKQKTYYESPLPFELPPEVAQMMAAVKPEVTITPTEEAKVVNGFNTTLTKVSIKMMGQDIAMDYWVSSDLGISQDQLREVSEAMFVGNPVLGELGKKLSTIEGYPVRIDTKVTAMGSTFASWQEVTKVEKKPAPPGTFEVPAGYTKTEKLQMGPA